MELFAPEYYNYSREFVPFETLSPFEGEGVRGNRYGLLRITIASTRS